MLSSGFSATFREISRYINHNCKISKLSEMWRWAFRWWCKQDDRITIDFHFSLTLGISLVSSRTDFNLSQNAPLEDESRRITCAGPREHFEMCNGGEDRNFFVSMIWITLFGVPVMAGSRGGLGRFDQEANGHGQHTYPVLVMGITNHWCSERIGSKAGRCDLVSFSPSND